MILLSAADATIVWWMLVLFNVSVKRNKRGSLSFCVGGHSVHEGQAIGGNEMRYCLFCAPLGSSLAQSGVHDGMAVVESESSLDSESGESVGFICEMVCPFFWCCGLT